MQKNQNNREWLTIPTLLTLGRLAAVPILILVAFWGHKNLFYILFLAMLATDALDGYLARKLNQVSTLGAKLDGWADLAMWSSALLCVWLLWPEVVRRELFFALFALCAYVLPLIAGFIKYKEAPIYHCWSAKFQAIFMSVAVALLLLADISWVFRIAAMTQGIAACEDIAITILLPKPHCDVPSFKHALKLKKTGATMIM